MKTIAVISCKAADGVQASICCLRCGPFSSIQLTVHDAVIASFTKPVVVCIICPYRKNILRISAKNRQHVQSFIWNRYCFKSVFFTVIYSGFNIKCRCDIFEFKSLLIKLPVSILPYEIGGIAYHFQIRLEIHRSVIQNNLRFRPNTVFIYRIVKKKIIDIT